MGSKNRSDPTGEKDSKVSDGGGDGGKQLITNEEFPMDPKFQQVLRHKTKFNTDPRFGNMFTDKSFSLSAAPLDKKQNTQNPLRHYRIEEDMDKEEETDEDEKEGEEEEDNEKVELKRGAAAALETAQLSDESEESEPASSSDDEEDVYEEQEEEEEEAQVQCLQPTMTTVSQHSFGNDPDEPVFTISVIENMKEDYGLFVWPCSVVLAEYVWQQRSRFSEASVVELGAGTSLPGLVAAKLGSNVTLTDDATRLEVLDNMRRVCELNDLNCKVMGLTWGVWDESVFSLSPQILIGADVLYDASAFDDLFATVSFLLQNSPGSVFIATYHNRSGHHLIEFLMVKWGLKCSKLIDGFSIMPPNKASAIRGNNIQLVELSISEP